MQRMLYANTCLTTSRHLAEIFTRLMAHTQIHTLTHRRPLCGGSSPSPNRSNYMFARFLFACVLSTSMFQPQSSQDTSVEYARRTISGLKSYLPAAGYVPDSETAIAIATAVLTPIYGKPTIDAEKPWKAGL